MTEVPIRDASTILLLRDSGPSFDVLLLRRNSRSSFMPDAFVYPGGVVEDADADVLGDLLATDVPAGESPDERRFYVAALRECFEESNLLVATHGTLPTSSNRSAWREKLLSDEVDMPAFLSALGLTVDLSSLAYFDRWITPSFESKRFDTRFFLARVTEVSHASQDDREVVEATWLGPAEALGMHARGELRLFPPTWMTLSWLTQFGSAAEAEDAARAREIWPIEPHFDNIDGQVVAYYPGHPKFPDKEARGYGGALWLLGDVWSHRRDRSEFLWSERDLE